MLDTRMLCRNVVKYLILGIVIAISCVLIGRNKMGVEEILSLSIVAGATFAIIDTFAPTMSYPAQFGAGFGIGAGLVGLA